MLIYVLQKYSNGQYWASPLPKGLPSAGLKFPCKAGVLLFFCKPSGIGPMISLPLGKAPKHYTKSASWVIPTGLLQECCFATRCRGFPDPGTSRAPEDALFDLNGPLRAKTEILGGPSNCFGCSPPVAIGTNRAPRRDSLGKKNNPFGASGVPKGGPFWFK